MHHHRQLLQGAESSKRELGSRLCFQVTRARGATEVSSCVFTVTAPCSELARALPPSLPARSAIIWLAASAQPRPTLVFRSLKETTLRWRGGCVGVWCVCVSVCVSVCPCVRVCVSLCQQLCAPVVSVGFVCLRHLSCVCCPCRGSSHMVSSCSFFSYTLVCLPEGPLSLCLRSFF